MWCFYQLTLNIFHTLFYCYYCLIRANIILNAGWIWGCIVLDNKLVFSNFGKYIILWARKTCWNICFHPYSPNLRLWKDKFSWQCFQKISRTLSICSTAPLKDDMKKWYSNGSPAKIQISTSGADCWCNKLHNILLISLSVSLGNKTLFAWASAAQLWSCHMTSLRMFDGPAFWSIWCI